MTVTKIATLEGYLTAWVTWLTASALLQGRTDQPRRSRRRPCASGVSSGANVAGYCPRFFLFCRSAERRCCRLGFGGGSGVSTCIPWTTTGFHIARYARPWWFSKLGGPGVVECVPHGMVAAVCLGRFVWCERCGLLPSVLLVLPLG